MKYLGLLFWLLFLIGSLHAGEPTGKMPAAPTVISSTMEAVPSIEVPERSHHLGKISLDRRYEHTFRVMNAGTGVLEIERVIVACGCELVYFDKTIPPGSEGTIIIAFEPRKCHDAVRKYAIVKSNDPKNFSFWLRLTWEH